MVFGSKLLLELFNALFEIIILLLKNIAFFLKLLLDFELSLATSDSTLTILNTLASLFVFSLINSNIVDFVFVYNRVLNIVKHLLCDTLSFEHNHFSFGTFLFTRVEDIRRCRLIGHLLLSVLVFSFG